MLNNIYLVTYIPPDDSNISDVFASDVKEDIKKGTNNCETEDGFKIVSDIPSDDSDVSDAFESDLDKPEWLKETQLKFKNKRNEKYSVSKDNSTLGESTKGDQITDDQITDDSKFSSLKKPLMKLIEDFGKLIKLNKYLFTPTSTTSYF